MEENKLIKILDEIDKVSRFQNGIMLLVRQERNEDARIKLLREYDKAEEYYKELENQIADLCEGKVKKYGK